MYSDYDKELIRRGVIVPVFKAKPPKNNLNFIFKGKSYLEYSKARSKVRSLNLKNANEIYLDIYNEARKKAKEAKLEAVQQYLMAKRIKQTYLLNEIDLSDSDDEDFLLFSEK